MFFHLARNFENKVAKISAFHFSFLNWKTNGRLGTRIETLVRPISNQKTKNELQNFENNFLIWNEKTNFEKYFTFQIWLLNWKMKNEKKIFWICFYFKPISKNKNQNFLIHFLISNQKLNFKKFFHFSISVLKLKNEKWKILKIRFVFKSKNELYFRYTNRSQIVEFCFSYWGKNKI